MGRWAQARRAGRAHGGAEFFTVTNFWPYQSDESWDASFTHDGIPDHWQVEVETWSGAEWEPAALYTVPGQSELLVDICPFPTNFRIRFRPFQRGRYGPWGQWFESGP